MRVGDRHSRWTDTPHKGQAATSLRVAPANRRFLFLFLFAWRGQFFFPRVKARQATKDAGYVGRRLKARRLTAFLSLSAPPWYGGGGVWGARVRA